MKSLYHVTAESLLRSQHIRRSSTATAQSRCDALSNIIHLALQHPLPKIRDRAARFLDEFEGVAIGHEPELDTVAWR